MGVQVSGKSIREMQGVGDPGRDGVDDARRPSSWRRETESNDELGGCRRACLGA